MKIYFHKAAKLLQDRNNILVQFDSSTGIVRGEDGEEKGELSAEMVEKLISKTKIEFIGNGSGLLDHEKYYRTPKN